MKRYAVPLLACLLPLTLTACGSDQPLVVCYPDAPLVAPAEAAVELWAREGHAIYMSRPGEACGVRIGVDELGDEEVAAQWFRDRVTIDTDRPVESYPFLLAHEFGHALGRGHDESSWLMLARGGLGLTIERSAWVLEGRGL